MKKRIIRSLIISMISSLFIFVVIKILYSSIDQSVGRRTENREVSSRPVSRQGGQARTIDPEFICKDCNVILITMTNLRYNHMSSNGYFRPTTPNLDALAKESIVFDNAFSHASWTLAEAISLYTGLYPFQHDIMERKDGSKLSPKIPTILEVLKKAGYTTAIFTGGFDYNVDYGLTNRFDKFEPCRDRIEFEPPLVSGRYKNSRIFGEFECVVPKALSWLRKNASHKFFMHVQGFDPHCPYSQRGGKTFDPDYQGSFDFSNCVSTQEPKEPKVIDGERYYLIRPIPEEVWISQRDVDHLIALYDESIVFADRQIGILLEEIKRMGLFDKTIIVFTSEHGEMFGKKGKIMRGGNRLGTFYDDVLHIPLMLKHPRLKTLRTDGLVSHIDIAPTLLDFLGLEKLNTNGKSMSPLIPGGEEVRMEVFAGTKLPRGTAGLFLSNRSYVAVVRTKDWKLIEETIVDENDNSSKNIELYDIVNDKKELNNIADTQKEVLHKMESKLFSWLNSVGQK